MQSDVAAARELLRNEAHLSQRKDLERLTENFPMPAEDWAAAITEVTRQAYVQLKIDKNSEKESFNKKDSLRLSNLSNNVAIDIAYHLTEQQSYNDILLKTEIWLDRLDALMELGNTHIAAILWNTLTIFWFRIETVPIPGFTERELGMRLPSALRKRLKGKATQQKPSYEQLFDPEYQEPKAGKNNVINGFAWLREFSAAHLCLTIQPFLTQAELKGSNAVDPTGTVRKIQEPWRFTGFESTQPDPAVLDTAEYNNNPLFRHYQTIKQDPERVAAIKRAVVVEHTAKCALSREEFLKTKSSSNNTCHGSNPMTVTDKVLRPYIQVIFGTIEDQGDRERYNKWKKMARVAKDTCRFRMSRKKMKKMLGRPKHRFEYGVHKWERFIKNQDSKAIAIAKILFDRFRGPFLTSELKKILLEHNLPERLNIILEDILKRYFDQNELSPPLKDHLGEVMTQINKVLSTPSADPSKPLCEQGHSQSGSASDGGDSEPDDGNESDDGNELGSELDYGSELDDGNEPDDGNESDDGNELGSELDYGSELDSEEESDAPSPRGSF